MRSTSRPSLRQLSWLVSGALVTVVVGAEGCRTPTQVTIDLRTVGVLSCQDLDGIDIVVAESAREAEDRIALGVLSTTVPPALCDADGHGIGTLVVIPSGGGGAIFVRARIKNAPDSTCTSPEYRGCIVARRAFSFIDHASVTLPIGLEAACEDVPCDVATSCRAGTCVDATAVCSESSGTCSSPADPIVGPDGGEIPPEDAAAGDSSAHDGAADGGKDAEISDAARDANADAGGRATNDCPVPGMPMDCKATLGGQAACCGGASWQCAVSSAACVSTPKLDCTGALHCAAGMWCCGVPQSQSSSCASVCTGGMGAFLCSSSGDCPPGLTCTGSGPGAGGVILATCR